MANVIRIEILNKDSIDNLYGRDAVLEAPLLDDISLSAKSDFSSLAELVPIIQTIKDKGMAFVSTTKNELSQGLIHLANAIDTPRWQKTQPFRLTAKFMFYTIDDPEFDVFVPYTVLQSQSILTKTDRGTYITPGISLQTMKAFNKKGDEAFPEDVIKKSKLVSVHIPGVIYIPLAIVESAIPTVSKEVTESGYPLWANVDLQLISALPANDGYFDNVLAEDVRLFKQSSKQSPGPSLTGRATPI